VGYFNYTRLTYAGLPDFEPVRPLVNIPKYRIASEAPDVQSSRSQLNRGTERWLDMDKLGVTGFIPSVTVGWDASARGSVETDEDMSRMYLYYPRKDYL
jgi:hypothetical protein